jgi:Domain of unknown function (DUF932)
MNAITKSFGTDLDTALETLDDYGILFNVAEEPVVTASGKEIPGKKALVNTISGEVVSVVGQKYKSISNIQIFDAFAESVVKSGLNTSGLKLDIKQAGARSLVKFAFPAETIKVPGDKSETALQIAVLNSFDGTTRYLTKAGGLRMACLNGNILGNIVGSYSSMHNNRLNIDQGAAQLVRMMQEFKGASEYWGRMMQRSVGTNEVEQVFAQFLLLDQTDEGWDEAPKFVKLMNIWDGYKREMGANAYALYNSLTDYITHRKSQPGSVASTRVYDERKLMKLLDHSPVFTK